MEVDVVDEEERTEEDVPSVAAEKSSRRGEFPPLFVGQGWDMTEFGTSVLSRSEYDGVRVLIFSMNTSRTMTILTTNIFENTHVS